MQLVQIVLAFAASVAAWKPAKLPYKCTEFMIPVPVNNATVIVPFLPEIQNEYQATYYANLFTTRGAAAPQPNLTTLTTTFNISGEHCQPLKPGAKASTLHLLTHGLGFNRSYWDFYLRHDPSPQYSYVHAATAAGYSTLSWNRLGIAPSTIANPYTEIQALVELSVLAGLTTVVRAGRIPSLSAPKKVIHVGHSWGSELSNGLAGASPALSDGLVLTGYSHNFDSQSLFLSSTTLHLANQNQPARFPNSTYSNGFLTWPDKLANQFAFLAYPNFDPAVLAYAESTKYPFTVGEFLSQGALPFEAPKFTGPVLYLEGEHDLIFCGSNCTGLLGRDSAAVTAFGASKSVTTYIQPGTGHGINLHKNATGAYKVINDWVGRHF